MHKAKLNGKFELNIKDNYEDHTRIRAFANDKLAFFIHKNGHFMNKLNNNIRYRMRPIRKIKIREERFATPDNRALMFRAKFK